MKLTFLNWFGPSGPKETSSSNKNEFPLLTRGDTALTTRHPLMKGMSCITMQPVGLLSTD